MSFAGTTQPLSIGFVSKCPADTATFEIGFVSKCLADTDTFEIGFVSKCSDTAQKKVLPGLEPGSLDSKSRVITITLQNRRR